MKQKIYYPENYLIYDLETTGVDPLTAEITEIAIKRVDQSGQSIKKSWLVKTKNPISKEASEITGITDEMLEKNGIAFSEIIDEIAILFTNWHVVGHNIGNYDNVIMDRYFTHADRFKMSKNFIDTGPIVKSAMMRKSDNWKQEGKRLWHESPTEFNDRIMKTKAWGIKWNLVNACKFYGIDISDLQAHRADADVEMVDRIYRKICLEQ